MPRLKEDINSCDFREKLSIEICDSIINHLKPYQPKDLKMGTLIAVRNFIIESGITDHILYSSLVDSISDNDTDVVNLVISIIKEIANDTIRESLILKLSEDIEEKTKKRIEKLLDFLTK